jgi:hypothetical protein
MVDGERIELSTFTLARRSKPIYTLCAIIQTEYGCGGLDRTDATRIMSPLLYQLSYSANDPNWYATQVSKRMGTIHTVAVNAAPYDV